MSEMVIKSVDGVDFPRQPSSYNVSYADVSKSSAGRTEDGTMHKDSIGTIAKIDLAFNGVPTKIAKQILAMFQKASGETEYFSVCYFDIKTCAYRTATFYCGDRGGECVQAFNQTYATSNVNEYGSYWNLTFNLIEQSPARW